MNIFIVEDEPVILEGITNTVQKVCPDDVVYSFLNPENAISMAKQVQTHIVFLDIELGEMNGIEAARELKRIYPLVNIVFVTSYSEYVMEAMRMHASGYILKPVTEERIRYELDDLRIPPHQIKKAGLWVRAFGQFEVFMDGVPVKFRYSKTKEMYALLIDRRGAMCTSGEVVAALWEDDLEDEQKKINYLKQLRKDLFDTFRDLNISHTIARQRNGIGVLVDDTPCDFYDWMAGDPQAILSYRGEYMTQYSWAENTQGWLFRTEREGLR